MKKYLSLVAASTLAIVSTFVVANASSSDLSNNSKQISLVANHTDEQLQLQTQAQSLELLNSKIIFTSSKGSSSLTLKDLPVAVETSINNNLLSNFTNMAAYLTNEKSYQTNSELEITSTNQLEHKILSSYDLSPSPTEPQLVFNNGEFSIIEGKNGHRISNMPEVESQLKQFSQSINISLDQITPSVSNQELLLKKELLTKFDPVNIKLSYPDKLYENSLEITKEKISLNKDDQYVISSATLSTVLEDAATVLEQNREDLIIHNIDKENNQVELTGNLINGTKINHSKLQEDINKALNGGSTEIDFQLIVDEATVINQFDETPYTLIGKGVSNFSGSGEGRKHNVRYASDSRYKSLYIPKDENFAFNSYLGGPVTLSRGWQTAYVISGGQIVPAPGGGICQMSTTVYRAALDAGLPIVRQDNHSLYVSYYTAYGDGLDATIFPGSKDLIFTNNTPGDLILHSSYDENDDLYVNLIGIDDGRSIKLTGPFYAGDNQNNPFGVTTNTNQINWVREITNSNGETQQETLTSTYSRFYRR